jgi:hypothetical protein
MEIAIPLIALGGMYVVSNQSNESCTKKEIRQQRQENFSNMGIRSNIPTNQSETYGNYLPNTNIPPQNLSLTIMYGGQPVQLSRTPTITYSPGFLTDVSGYVLTRATANQFSGDIYMGNITFSNILLATSPKNTFDFYVEYIPSYIKSDYIDNFSLFIKTNRSSNSAKLFESGLKFSHNPCADPITTFGLTGIQG